MSLLLLFNRGYQAVQYVRSASEATAASDAAQGSRVTLLTSTESSAISEVASRSTATVRSQTQTANTLDVALRTSATQRSGSDSVGVLTLLATSSQTYPRTASQPLVSLGDDPLVNPTYSVKGVVRTRDGYPYVNGAQVRLLRDDGVVVASMVSNPDGSYEFLRNSTDTHTYRVFAYDSATPSDQNITGTLAPLPR